MYVYIYIGIDIFPFPSMVLEQIQGLKNEVLRSLHSQVSGPRFQGLNMSQSMGHLGIFERLVSVFMPGLSRTVRKAYEEPGLSSCFLVFKQM